MRIRLSRLILFAVVLVVVGTTSLVTGVGPSTAPLAKVVGIQAVRAGTGCFAWGINGAPSNDNAPPSLCDQCTALALCAATDGKNFMCGNCAPPPSPPPPVPNKPSLDAGPACLGGTSRQVNLSGSGDTFQIQINTGATVAGPTYTFSGLQAGTAYSFRGQAFNTAGGSGWSAWSGQVSQDTQAPVTTPNLVGTIGKAGWWRSAVSVALTAQDVGCLGVRSTSYTVDGGAATYTAPFVIQGEGSHQLSYSSSDGTNVELPQNQTIRIDTVAPSLSLSPSRPPDSASGWYRSPVTVSLTSSDATSGIASQQVNLNNQGWVAYSTPLNFAKDGKFSLDAQVSDVAGNQNATGVVVPVDMTAPTTTVSLQGQLGQNGWYTSPSVQLTLTATDATSGVLQTLLKVDGVLSTYTQPLTITGEGIHTVAYGSVDVAGNVETIHQLTIPIDSVAPSLSLTPDRAPDSASGWYRSSITVAVTASDATSGLAAQKVSLDGQAYTAYDGKPILITGDRLHQLSVQVTDGAGLTTTQSLTLPLDGTPPTSTISFGDRGAGNAWHIISPVHVYVSATDNLSGGVQTFLSVDGQPATTAGQLAISGGGVHWIDYYAVDSAGNVEVSHHLPVSIDLGLPSVDSVSCSAGQLQPNGDFSLTANLLGSVSGVWQVKLTAYPDGGQPFQVDATTLTPPQQQAQVTLHFHPTSAQVGHYWFGLLVMSFAGQSVSPGSLCGLTVTTTLSGSPSKGAQTVHFPTRTATPVPSTPSTLPPTPTSTLPLTNTPNGMATLAGGLMSSLTPTSTPTLVAAGAMALQLSGDVVPTLLPTETLSPTPQTTAVALLLPADNSANQPNVSSVGGNPGPGSTTQSLISGNGASSNDDLSAALAKAAALGSVTGALALTAFATKRRRELDDEQAQEAARRQAAIQQQAQQATQAEATNAAVVAAADQEVTVAPALSDAMQSYLAAMAQWESWAEDRARKQQAWWSNYIAQQKALQQEQLNKMWKQLGKTLGVTAWPKDWTGSQEQMDRLWSYAMKMANLRPNQAASQWTGTPDQVEVLWQQVKKVIKPAKGETLPDHWTGSVEGLFAQWMGTASYVYAEQAAWAQAVKAARAIVQATDGDRAQHYDAKTLQQRLAAIIKDDFKDTSVKANADLFTLVGTAQQLNQNNQQAIDAMIAGQGWTDVHVPESVKQQFTQQRIQEWVKATNDLAQANVVSATDKPLVILQAYQQAYAQQNELAMRQMMAVPPSMLWRLPPNYKQQTIQSWVDKTNALLGPNHAPLVTAETPPATILKVYQQLSLEVGQQKDVAVAHIMGVPTSALIRIPDEVKQQAIQSWVDKTNALLSPNGMPLVTVKTDPVTLLSVYYQQLSLQAGQQEDQAVAQMMGVPASVLWRLPDEIKQQAIQRWVDKTNALLGPNQPALVTVNTDPATILKVYQQLSLQIGQQIALQVGQQNDLATSYIMGVPASVLWRLPDEIKQQAIQRWVDKTNALAGQTVVNAGNDPSMIWNTYVQVREDRGVSDAYTLLHGHPPQGDINAAQVKADLAAQINRDLGRVMYHGQEDAAALVTIYNQIQTDKAAQQDHLKAISPPTIRGRYERSLNSPYQNSLSQDHDIQVFVDQQTALDKALQPGEAIKAMIGNALQDVDGGTGYLQSLTSQWFGTNALAHTVTGLGQTLIGGLVRTNLRNKVSQTLGLDSAAIPTSWPVALLQNVNQAAQADPQGTKNGLASLNKAIQILGLDQQWSHTVGGIDQAWFNTASDGHLSLNTGAIDQAVSNAGWQLDYYKRYISLLNPALDVNTLADVPAAQALAAQAYAAADADTQSRAQRRMIADQGYQIVGKQVNALGKIDQAFGTPQSISDWAALSADKLALLSQPFPQRLNADGVFNSPIVQIEQEKTVLQEKLMLTGQVPPINASLPALQQMWAATPEADRQAARVGYARYLDQQMRAQGAGVAIGFSETAAGFLFPPLVPVFSFLHAGADALQGNVGGALFSASIGLLSSGALTYSAAVGRAAAAEAAVGTEAVQGIKMLDQANTIAEEAGVPSLFTPEVVTDWTTDLQTWKAAQQSGLVSQLTDTLKLSTPFADQLEGTTAYLDGVYQPTLPSIIRDGLAQVSNRFVRQGLEVALSSLDDTTALAVWSKLMGDGALDTTSLLPAMTNELGLATTSPLLLPTPLSDAAALALVRPSADVTAQIAAGGLIPFNPLIPFTPPAPVISVPLVQPPVLVPSRTMPAISVPPSSIPIPTTTLPSGIVVPIGAVGLDSNLPIDSIQTLPGDGLVLGDVPPSDAIISSNNTPDNIFTSENNLTVPGPTMELDQEVDNNIPNGSEQIPESSIKAWEPFQVKIEAHRAELDQLEQALEQAPISEEYLKWEQDVQTLKSAIENIETRITKVQIAIAENSTPDTLSQLSKLNKQLNRLQSDLYNSLLNPVPATSQIDAVKLFQIPNSVEITPTFRWRADVKGIKNLPSEFHGMVKDTLLQVQRWIATAVQPRIGIDVAQAVSGVSFYGNGVIALSSGNLEPRVVVHELGHYVEEQKRLAPASIAFLMSRSSFTHPVSISTRVKEMTGIPSGGWYRNYSFRVYLPEKYIKVPLDQVKPNMVASTEVISTGLDQLYSDPKGFYMKDPAHFEFTIAALRGWIP